MYKVRIKEITSETKNSSDVTYDTGHTRTKFSKRKGKINMLHSLLCRQSEKLKFSGKAGGAQVLLQLETINRQKEETNTVSKTK